MPPSTILSVPSFHQARLSLPQSIPDLVRDFAGLASMATWPDHGCWSSKPSYSPLGLDSPSNSPKALPRVPGGVVSVGLPRTSGPAGDDQGIMTAKHRMTR